MILTYFLPLAIMIVIYVSIGFELWGQRVIGEATTHQQDSINSKRRVSFLEYFIELTSHFQKIKVFA